MLTATIKKEVGAKTQSEQNKQPVSSYNKNSLSTSTDQQPLNCEEEEIAKSTQQILPQVCFIVGSLKYSPRVFLIVNGRFFIIQLTNCNVDAQPEKQPKKVDTVKIKASFVNSGKENKGISSPVCAMLLPCIVC